MGTRLFELARCQYCINSSFVFSVTDHIMWCIIQLTNCVKKKTLSQICHQHCQRFIYLHPAASPNCLSDKMVENSSAISGKNFFLIHNIEKKRYLENTVCLNSIIRSDTSPWTFASVVGLPLVRSVCLLSVMISGFISEHLFHCSQKQIKHSWGMFTNFKRVIS